MQNAAQNATRKNVYELLIDENWNELKKRNGNEVLDYTTDSGETLLHILARSRSVFRCERFIKTFKAPINVINIISMETPLHVAVKVNDPDMIQMLIIQGALVYAINQHKQTPLHVAAIWGNLAACRILIASGARVDTKDENGHIPLNRFAFSDSCHNCTNEQCFIAQALNPENDMLRKDIQPFNNTTTTTKTTTTTITKNVTTTGPALGAFCVGVGFGFVLAKYF